MDELQQSAGATLTKAGRKSGVELLKIIAISCIVFYHVLTTAGNLGTDYSLNLTIATSNVEMFFLAILKNLGAFGNMVFFICSAWFLFDEKKNKKVGNKISMMIADIWVISMLFLIGFLIARGGVLSGTLIIKSIFPTTFGNNWYLTCYIVFYAIYPLLNKLINVLDNRRLLLCCALMILINVVINFIGNGLYFTNSLTLFITLYFCIAYIKKYKRNICESLSVNCWLIAIGVIGNLLMMITINLLGMKISFFSNKLLFGCKNSNPFIIITVFGLFNLANRFTFSNKFINELSSYSLIIYIIHENILLRELLRSKAFVFIYNKFGYEPTFLVILILSVITFIIAVLLSALYKYTLQRLTKKVSNYIYNLLAKLYKKIESKIVKEDKQENNQ